MSQSVCIVHDTPILSGIHLQLIDSVSCALGMKYEIVNVMPKMPDKDLKKIKPDRWLEERARILDATTRHDKILCAGGLATATVFGLDKTVAVTKVRGRGMVVEDVNKYAVATYSPSTVVKDQDFFRDLVFDMEKLATHDAPIPVPEIEIQLVETKKDLRLLRELHGASFLGMDIETTGFGIHAVPLSIGFGALTDDGGGYVVVVPQRYIGDEVLKFLQTYDGYSVFHNLKFDIQHLMRHFGHFELRHPADTMMMHYALDERPFNRYRSHALKLLARLYYDAPDYDLDMGKWLEQFFREDIGNSVRMEWVEEFCAEHAEAARTCWRRWYEGLYGEEPDWRGRKVGRDIPVEDVAMAVMMSKMPRTMLPPPNKLEKKAMLNDLHTYQGLDCYYTARLFPDLKAKMDEESERLFPLIDKYYVPASIALARMEMNGVKIDIPYFQQMRAHLAEQLEHDLVELRRIVEEQTGLLFEDKEGFNPNSSHQVKKVLYGEEGLDLDAPKNTGRYAWKQSGESTNKDVLKYLAKEVARDRPQISDLIERILRYRIRSKILGTYVDGILDRCDSDGRVRGDFNLHGTATGRTSCSNPNLQNIPDASHVGYDIRKGFLAEDGYVMLEADFSQLELRVAALFSQDPVLLDVYRQGGDIHQEVALLLWNKPKDQVTKYERYLAKCMNFGVIYGRGGRSIATGPEMDNLKEISGRSWSIQEIENYFNKFKVGYNVLFKWMEEVKKDSVKKQHVENPLGFRRRFDCILDSSRGHIERQTVNTPIQGFAGQMMIWAIVQMTKELDPERCRVLFTVHDSVCLEATLDYAQEAASIVKRIMEEGLPDPAWVTLPQLPHSPFKVGEALQYNLPFVADVNIGPNWGECKHNADDWYPLILEEEDEVAA